MEAHFKGRVKVCTLQSTGYLFVLVPAAAGMMEVCGCSFLARPPHTNYYILCNSISVQITPSLRSKTNINARQLPTPVTAEARCNVAVLAICIDRLPGWLCSAELRR